MERKAVLEAQFAGPTGRRKSRHYEKEKTAMVDTYGAALVSFKGGRDIDKQTACWLVGRKRKRHAALRAILRGMVGHGEESECGNAKGVKTWGVVLHSPRGWMRMPVNGEHRKAAAFCLWRLALAQGANREVCVERGFGSGLAVKAYTSW
ncbi:hypothetical protein M433DRAFT_8967 [Acidomyces richmondensis BFW]|nr:hypothetical protein M433DRAFT_8967 [Acidomyces richmondensis BFW]